MQCYVSKYSHHVATRSLGAWLESEGVPGITGIDTRTLTRRLREHGIMKGWLLPVTDDAAVRNAAETIDMKEVFRLVTPDNVIRYERGALKVLLVDAGAKDNMVRSLLKRGRRWCARPGTLTSRRSPPTATASSLAMGRATRRT